MSLGAAIRARPPRPLVALKPVRERFQLAGSTASQRRLASRLRIWSKEAIAASSKSLQSWVLTAQGHRKQQRSLFLRAPMRTRLHSSSSAALESIALVTSYVAKQLAWTLMAEHL